jgi:hypothetical protein
MLLFSGRGRQKKGDGLIFRPGGAPPTTGNDTAKNSPSLFFGANGYSGVIFSAANPGGGA